MGGEVGFQKEGLRRAISLVVWLLDFISHSRRSNGTVHYCTAPRGHSPNLDATRVQKRQKQNQSI